jgi:vanillate O-demethylase monooxygenase subunit
MFLRNSWYVAATADELGRALLARTFLDEPVVLYRRQDGRPVALEDRCSHRFYPLSLGDLKGDLVVCGYHGLEFDCSGACVRIPAQSRVPPAAAIRSYPVTEKWRLVWIWMGEPALADESLIPNLWTNEHADWTLVMGDVLHVKADYMLLTDNLMDTSHVTFLHKTTLGTADVAEIPHDAEFLDNGVRVTRWTMDKPPAPMFAKFGGFTANVDRWQINTYLPPGLIEVDIGSCLAGTGAREGNRSQGVEILVHNLATPETRDSFHYFWAHTRRFAPGDRAMSELVREQVLTALAEDVRAMEGVHAGLARFAGKRTFDIRADGAGLRARRLLGELIAKESGQAPAAA